jgi:predicted MFS family arabinose efflux permease
MLGVLLPFALAHFVSYLYRNVNTVVYPDLVRDIGLDANTLGLLTGVYFIAFAAAQLPVGLALDRFGPRRVQVPMLAVAALGGLLFAQAQSLQGLLAARALIGLGVSASLMAAIKASSQWLPPERLPMSTAVLLAVGGLGAMASTAPMQWATNALGWRMAFWGIAACAAAVAWLIFARVPEYPTHQPAPRLSAMLKSVGQLYARPLFWRTALCTLFANAAYLAVQGLWMGPWLRDVGHLPRAEVAQVLFASTVAMVAGSLSFGALTDWLARRHRVRPITVCGAGVAVFMLCQLLMLWPSGAALHLGAQALAHANPLANTPTPPLAPTHTAALVPHWLLAVAFSYFGTAGAMNYAILAQGMPAELTGRVSTSFNLLIFLAAFGLQWGLGAVINLWPADHGTYPEAAYQTALAVCLAMQVPGLLLWLGFKPWQLAPAPRLT